MKRKVTKIVTFCDCCKKEAEYARPCMTCGKEICYNCAETEAVDYPHSVYCSGSGDGRYCNKCDKRHLEKLDNPKHKAYRMIVRLRSESSNYYEDFQRRAKLAEDAVKNS